jgi:hypothetical protein
MLRLLLAASIALVAACGRDTATPGETDESDDMGVDMVTPDAGNTNSGGEDAGGIEYPDVGSPPIPVAVETEVVSPVRAGETLDVTCRLLTENGDVVEPDEAPEFSVAVAPEGSFAVTTDGYRAERVGEGTARCSVPELGLVDQTPAPLEIIPGRAYTSVIDVDKSQMVAGDTVTATCTFYDEYGNLVDPDDDGQTPQLVVAPSGGGIDVAGFAATITVADVYSMSCSVSGLTVEQSVPVEVVPDLPATFVINAAPNQPVYGLGQVVRVTWIVTDQYGNEIPNAEVSFSVNPSSGAESFGSGRYRFDEEGTYTITATVEGPTQGGQPLQRSVTVVVNGEGPGISCDDPFDGSMVDVAPGQAITFSGSVADANGVQSLLVNGSGTTVNADGSFDANVTADWGMNFVEIVATDEFGEENSRTCSFLASDYWSAQNNYMDDSILLALRQAAVDDSNPSDLDSLNDLLHRVINSQGIIDEVDQALSDANPLQPFTCESETCVFGLCVCWFGWGVDYDNQIRVGGPNTTDLDLISNGLRAHARIEDLGIRVHVPYVVSEIPGDTDGWVDLDYIDVTMDIDVALENNTPHASIRPGTVNVSVGGVDTSFSGLDGAIVNLVIDLFEGTVRGLIADTLRDFIESSFDQVIDGVVSSLDISTLGATFNVPTLDGGDTVPVRFNLRFSKLSALSARLAFGIGTRFTPVLTRNGNPSLGVPRPHSGVWYEPATSQPVMVGVYVSVLNHVLHALWRGGLFDATLTGADLGGSFPADAQATIAASLPPVVQNLDDGTVKLGLGGLSLALTYPGVFDDPLNVTLGAIASSTVTVQGDELQFGNLSIDELVFSTTDVSLDATTRSVLEDFLRSIVQSIVDTSLNQSLPALPIPTFEIPANLSQYNLPANAELGILNPSLEITNRQYLLKGTFGVR